MVAALDASGSRYEFIRYKDQGHLGITEEVIQKTLDFISALVEEANFDG